MTGIGKPGTGPATAAVAGEGVPRGLEVRPAHHRVAEVTERAGAVESTGEPLRGDRVVDAGGEHLHVAIGPPRALALDPEPPLLIVLVLVVVQLQAVVEPLRPTSPVLEVDAPPPWTGSPRARSRARQVDGQGVLHRDRARPDAPRVRRRAPRRPPSLARAAPSRTVRARRSAPAAPSPPRDQIIADHLESDHVHASQSGRDLARRHGESDLQHVREQPGGLAAGLLGDRERAGHVEVVDQRREYLVAAARRGAPRRRRAAGQAWSRPRSGRRGGTPTSRPSAG